jgi:hypothetical protein
MKLGNNQVMPRARKADLVVKEMPDELLVYDLKRDRIHVLNQSAAFIWRQCNGRRTVDDLARAVAKSLQIPEHEQVVWLALEELGKYHLLEEKIARPESLAQMSRRDMMRLAVAAAVALPIIVSIVAPTAASAQTAISPSVCNGRVQPNCGGTPCTGGSGTQTCTPFQANACRCQ